MNDRLLELVTKNKELILIGLICGVGMGIVGLAFTIAEVLWRKFHKHPQGPFSGDMGQPAVTCAVCFLESIHAFSPCDLLTHFGTLCGFHVRKRWVRGPLPRDVSKPSRE